MKIRVFFPIWIVIVVAIFMDLGLWILVFCYGVIQSLEVYGLILMSFFAGILPLSLFIYVSLTMTNIIEFNERGVCRVRFGRIIRKFSWEEVQTIASTADNEFSGWIYISDKKKQYDFIHITRMRLDKDIIYFHFSKKAMEALIKYAPEEFQEKLNSFGLPKVK